MRRGSPFNALVLLLASASLALVAYAFVAPMQQDEASHAVAALGYRVDEIKLAPHLCNSSSGRIGYAWRSGRVTGKVCVGGFLPAQVSVFR